MSTAGFRKCCKCQFVPLHAEAQDSLINPWKIQFIHRLCRSVLGLIGERIAEILSLGSSEFPFPPLMLFQLGCKQNMILGGCVHLVLRSMLQETTKAAVLLELTCDFIRSLAQQVHWSLTSWVVRVCTCVCVHVCERKRQGERVISHRSKHSFAPL